MWMRWRITWAWSVMPIVATGPSCFTHSCEDAYFNPSKTAKSHIIYRNQIIVDKDKEINRMKHLWWCLKERVVPVEKQRERENAGERWALEAEESLSALAVEEAHTLKAMLSCCRLSVSFWFSNKIGWWRRILHLFPRFIIILDEWWETRASS
jgi:hypothetical protein